MRPATMQDGNPNGYYVFYFDGNQVKPRFIPAGGDPNDRLRLTLEPQLLSSGESYPLGLERGVQPDSMYVIVNYFDGGERDTVTISLDGNDAQPMEHVERIDPYMQRQYEAYKDTDDALGVPVISSHIWQYLLPDLPLGIHSVVVRVVDEFGYEDQEVLTFEIVE